MKFFGVFIILFSIHIMNLCRYVCGDICIQNSKNENIEMVFLWFLSARLFSVFVFHIEAWYMIHICIKSPSHIYYCHSRNKVCSLRLCRLSSFHSLDEQFNTRLCAEARYVRWNFYFNKIFDANRHYFYAIHYTDTKIEIKGDTLMHDMFV